MIIVQLNPSEGYQDTSGNNTLVLINGSIPIIQRNNESVYRFNGPSNRFHLPGDILPALDKWCIEIIFELQNHTSDFELFGQLGSGGSTTQHCAGNSSKFYAVRQSVAGQPWEVRGARESIEPGINHVALVWDGSVIRLFANGKKIGEHNISGAPWVQLSNLYFSVGGAPVLGYEQYFKGLTGWVYGFQISDENKYREDFEPPGSLFFRGRLEGDVKIKGEPMEGATVLAYREDTNELVATTQSDSQGTFAFNTLNPDKKYFIVVKPNDENSGWEYRVSSRRTPK